MGIPMRVKLNIYFIYRFINNWYMFFVRFVM
jgi:hypothetical protein